MEKVIINGMARVDRPAVPPPVVLLHTNHGRIIKLALPAAQKVADWLAAQMDAGADLKIKTGLMADDALSVVCDTASGPATLQFSPEAAKDYVAMLRGE